jgi:putative SOS response-associated peptidase YedK
MCGRFTLSVDFADLEAVFPGLTLAAPQVLEPRFNIAPTQPVAVVRNDGRNQVEMVRWGLIPWWAKDASIGNRLINARSETLSEKPAFREALERRRCLVLADGFYEWQRLPGHRHKTPVYVRLKDGTPFAFAGLWDSWRTAPGDRLLTCTIITTPPNELIEPIHDRMPAMLKVGDAGRWIESGPADPHHLETMLAPYPAAAMEVYPVSRRVNDVDVDDPACVERQEPTTPENYSLFE